MENSQSKTSVTIQHLNTGVNFTWSTEPQILLQGESELTAEQGGSHGTTVAERERESARERGRNCPRGLTSPSHLQKDRVWENWLWRHKHIRNRACLWRTHSYKYFTVLNRYKQWLKTYEHDGRSVFQAEGAAKLNVCLFPNFRLKMNNTELRNIFISAGQRLRILI